MFSDRDVIFDSHIVPGLDALSEDDLPPAAAARIEAACLTRLRRRQRSALRGHESLLVVLEFALVLLLGCGYLLEALARALAVYGAHVR
jgi:hypothetical protein